MPRLLRSVRAKLMALVGLSSLVAVAVVPLVGWLMRTELMAEIDDRIEGAEQAFEIELADDIRDLSLAAKLLAEDDATAKAMAGRDAATLQRLAKRFHAVYQDFDVAFYDAQGRMVATVGCADPWPDLARHPVVDALKGSQFAGLTRHGCERLAAKGAPPPAWTVAVPIAGGGLVLACLPLDQEFVANSATKLNVDLALAEVVSGNPTVFARSPRFGQAVVAGGQGTGVRLIHTEDRGDLATVWFKPKALASGALSVTCIARMDVAGVEAAMQSHLQLAVALIALAMLVSLYLGSRIATVMSRALQRISAAHRRLQDQEYVKVGLVHTGDEIEDLATGFNSMVEGLQERDRLRTTLGKYMTEQVVSHLLAGKIQLGGESLPVTVLFSDIRGFTGISENMGAQELVALLNEYFTEMVAIIMQEGGVVDKYIGDAIMAVFGAPVPKPDDAVRAVRAAVRMRKALIALNVRLAARGHKVLQTGIGLHTGEVVAGNIGSELRMEYTVIGDAVNVASRLETATKDLGVNVLCSQDTWALVHGEFTTRPMGEIHVKGRQQAVQVYEIDGTQEAFTPAPQPAV